MISYIKANWFNLKQKKLVYNKYFDFNIYIYISVPHLNLITWEKSIHWLSREVRKFFFKRLNLIYYHYFDHIGVKREGNELIIKLVCLVEKNIFIIDIIWIQKKMDWRGIHFLKVWKNDEKILRSHFWLLYF